MSSFRASKSQSQGREGWCALMRHPVRKDARGAPLRIRRGLGTRDADEADRLVTQLNVLLADESYWNPAARARAEREMDTRVVTIFFDEMPLGAADAWAQRDEVIPLPDREAGYAKVLIVGPTGAGKTTLVRQLIGTDPKLDRFPSTSTAKTTVSDIEIVVGAGPFRAVVSFVPRDRARLYVEECVVASVSAAAEGQSAEEVARRLLEHTEQRFRLSYLLGSAPRALGATGDTAGEADDLSDSDDETDERDAAPADAVEVSTEERTNLDSRLRLYLERVDALAAKTRSTLIAQLGGENELEAMKARDRDAFLELLEDALHENEDTQALADDVFDDIERRFDLLTVGTVERDKSEWPTRWCCEIADRAEFIKVVNRFSSNYAPNFGRLLTPLVVGIRVAGPFRPAWLDDDDDAPTPKIVLLDGEGLGHTPDSAFSLPTSLTKRYDRADLILLVDSATQPMVAGSLTVLRSLSASGHEAKLAVVFTHFDQVKGDNLPNETAKRNHVRGSLDNALQGVETVLGPGASRSLQRHLERRIFFLAKIDEVLQPKQKATRAQLADLLRAIDASIVRPPPPKAAPVYDLANLVLGVTQAARLFHASWDKRLPAEHWTRIKALTRRLGYLGEDQYDTLQPVAELIGVLQEQARTFIVSPRSWEPETPTEDERQSAVNLLSQEFFRRLHALVADRLWAARLHEWQVAYDRRGSGSGAIRRNDVRGINGVAAPIPGAAPTPDATAFLDAVRRLFVDAAGAAGAKVL